MKILVFTEGTILMPGSGRGLSRDEIVELSRKEGVQREEATLKYESEDKIPVEHNSVHDYANYIPHGDSVRKLNNWKNQGHAIYYLSSRRIKSEVEAIKKALQKYSFPDSDNLLFRREGDDYKDVAERLMPDILIEDDCESIGGEREMVYPHIKPELRDKIRSIVVKEFEGINHLPDNLSQTRTSKSLNIFLLI